MRLQKTVILFLVSSVFAQVKPLLLSDSQAHDFWLKIQKENSPNPPSPQNSQDSIKLNQPDSLHYIIRPQVNSENEDIIVLSNGTEVGRFLLTDQDAYLKIQSLQEIQEEAPVVQSFEKFKKSNKSQSSIDEPSFLETLAKHSNWQEGLHASTGLSLMTFHERAHEISEYKIGWTQKLEEFHFGGALGNSTAAGYNRLKVSADYVNDPASNFFWEAYIGFPGVRLGVESRVHNFPRYGFIEDKFEAIRFPDKSSTLNYKYYEGEYAEPSRTITTVLELKYSYLHYRRRMNSDLYQNSINEINLEELPVSYGNWGMGVLWSGRSMFGGFSTQVRSLDFNIPWGSQTSSFEWVPLDLQIYLRSLRHYQMSLYTRIYFSNPFRSFKIKVVT